MTPHHVLKVVATALIVFSAAVRPATTQEKWDTNPPLLRIGAGAEDGRWFHNVETVFIRDSVLYVADRGSAQIRGLHWRSGEVLYIGGRPGEGPGEFEWLSWADDCTTDSIVAYDAGAKRLSVFSAELEHLRTFALDTPDSIVEGLLLMPQTTRCAGPTTLLVVYLTVDVQTALGRYRPSMVLGQHSLSGGQFQGIMGDEFPGDERYRFDRSDGPLQWGKKTMLAGFRDGGFVLGTGDGAWLTRHDRGGAVRDTVWLGKASPVSISESDIRALQDRHLDAARRRGADLARIRRQQREYDYPEHYPLYSKLFVSSDEKIWIQAYPTSQSEGNHWWVVGEEGDVVATVNVPSNYDVLWANGQYVAGVARDRLGVEYVEVREIVKPGQ